MLKALVLILALGIQMAAHAGVAEAGKYVIDQDHSHVGFEVRHLGIAFVVGRFNTFAGTFDYQPGATSAVQVEVQTSSIDSNVGQRDDHLRSGDFFNVAQFPTMKFESKTVEYDAEGVPKRIEGLLTLHGQTKTLSLNVTPLGGGQGPMGETRAGFRASQVIKRSDFGMNSLMAIAGDEITLNLVVEGIRE